MPDLDQANPEVSRYLLRAARFWLNFNAGGAQIAGFRVDAIKHVGARFWQAFEEVVIADRPDAILFGEYFDGGSFNLDSLGFIDETKYFSMFDFEVSIAALRYFALDRKWNGRTHVLRELIDDTAPSWGAGLFRAATNPANVLNVSPRGRQLTGDRAINWGAFLENHDIPRVRTTYPDMSDEAYVSALAFLFCLPRVPVLMYGTEIGLGYPNDPREQGLFGTGGDPFNRPMMIFPGDPGWNESIHAATKKLIAFRKGNPVLRRGRSRFLFPPGTSRSQDLFLAREDATATTPGAPAILFAYSTEGHDVSIPATEFAGPFAVDVLTGERLEPVDGAYRFPLAAQTARVLRFAPDSSAASKIGRAE